jgi:putative inorganic carbon (HCO3(-)) transporter
MSVDWERRVALAGLAFGFGAIPLFPALIFLAALVPPGVSVVPPIVARVVLALAVLGAIAMYGLTLRRGTAWPVTVRAILVYIGGWAVAGFLGLDPATGVLFVLAGTLALSLYLGVEKYYRMPRASAVVLGSFLASGLAAALLGLVMVATRRPAELYTLAHGRAVSSFIVPGELAGYLCFLVPTGAGVALAARRGWLRALGAAAAVAGVAAMWMTYSRAGIYGLSVGAAFFIFMQRRRWWLALLLVVALALEARWLIGFDDHHNPGEDFTRLPIWHAALRAIELFPLTGVGPGAFRHVYPFLEGSSSVQQAFHAHSYLLTAFAETGALGIATLLALWWCFGRELVRRLRVADGSTRTFALALTAGFVATWVQGAVDFVQVVVFACWIPFMALTLEAARHGTADG